MKAKKDNKVYRIDERMKKRYMDDGYDIFNDDGSLQEYSPAKCISYAEHKKALEAARKEHENGVKEVTDFLLDIAEERGVDLGKTTSLSGLVKKIRENRPGGGG